MEPGFEFWKQVMSSRPVIGGELVTWPQHSPLIGPGDEQHAEPLPAAGGEDDHPHHLGGVLQPLQISSHREGELHQHQQGPFIIYNVARGATHSLAATCTLLSTAMLRRPTLRGTGISIHSVGRSCISYLQSCNKLHFMVQVKRGNAWKVVGRWLPQRQELGTQWGKILALHGHKFC